MPNKRTQDFQKLTIAEQQAVIDRFKGRKDVRDANRKLAKLVLSWVLDHPMTDQEFMEIFEAAGHEGEYHEKPNVTTGKRVFPQATELPSIVKRLEDTPLDYMGALELKFVLKRILMILDEIEDTPGKTMQEAIALYRIVGDAIRQHVFTETGHYPEQFPMPRGRITGNEEPGQFKLINHQPTLF